MKQNVGKADKVVRVIVALALAGLGYYFHLWYLYVIAAVPLLTAAIGFCPLYTLLKVNTAKSKKK